MIAVLAIIAASLLTAVIISGWHSANNSTTTTVKQSSIQVDTTQKNTKSSSTSTSLTGGTTTQITSSEDVSCPSSCTLDVDWASLTKPYNTLAELAAASDFVFLGNVTAAWTLPSGAVPVDLYNITVVTTLKGQSYTSVVQVGEIGGTTGNKSVTVSGYPSLAVGETYVLFVFPSGGVCCTNGTFVIPNAPFSLIVDMAFPSALPYVTQGGPQGLFYVQNGNVYSLDNEYPQADAWLPFKADGVPLAQFESEIVAASVSTTSTSLSATNSTQVAP